MIIRTNANKFEINMRQPKFTNVYIAMLQIEENKTY